MDMLEHNRKAWDLQVERGNPWTIPVRPEQIAAARNGSWSVLLTPTIPVPREWFGEVSGKDILLLASGGGQQGPILAAAGARVTVFDNSPRQLDRDREVAIREGLELITIQGDMRDLSIFQSDSFDLIFHPVANCFVDNVIPIWRESARTLRHGGVLLSGFCNPVLFSFDFDLRFRQGIYKLRHSLPYADLDHYNAEERDAIFGSDAPLKWSHTLTDQIGGQLAAGLILTGFYEDTDPDDKLSIYMPIYIATRAIRP